MILALAGTFALAACEEKKTEEVVSQPTTATSAPVAQQPAAPVAVTINDSDLSTPADFEETAEKSITKVNYKKELSSLESDINAPL